ncbi:MAG: hypothetical protein V4721_02155 [Bacteroidota bacterium]
MSGSKNTTALHSTSPEKNISTTRILTVLLGVILFYPLQESIAQENEMRRKSVYAEFLGNGGFLTANYDVRLNPGRNNGLGVRAGIGFGGFHFLNSDPYWVNSIKSGTKYTSIPLQLNYIWGKRRSGLEAGLGITPEFTLNKKGTDPAVQVTGLLNLGYRLQPLDNGLSFRIVASPGIYQGRVFPIGAGISLGYSFK